jgi:hypothetical protein
VGADWQPIKLNPGWDNAKTSNPARDIRRWAQKIYDEYNRRLGRSPELMFISLPPMGVGAPAIGSMTQYRRDREQWAQKMKRKWMRFTPDIVGETEV